MKLIIHQKWYLQQVKDTFTSLQAPRLNWALRNALNTAAKQVERFTEKQVADVASAQSKRVKKGVYIKEKATAKLLETDIIGSGTPIPLKFFQARETKRGVTYKHTKCLEKNKSYPMVLSREEAFQSVLI